MLDYLLFDIGVLNIRVWDILDVLIVAYLMYLIYKLLRGTIAFNIFIGVVLLYVIWWLVQILDMSLLSLLLSKFVAFGVIILIIIFQPEVRRFLLLLGDTTLKGRLAFLERFFNTSDDAAQDRMADVAKEIQGALQWMSRQRIGALIVIGPDTAIQSFTGNGNVLNADVSDALLRSIFVKNSPLHDGAVLIYGNKIQSAGVVLPVSNSPSIPKHFGLRHRAGIGVTENNNVACFIVSEETGEICFTRKGRITRDIRDEALLQSITKYL